METEKKRQLIEAYPRKDRTGRPRFVKYPVFDDEESQMWICADVNKGCYAIPTLATKFETEEECQKVCDTENDFWSYTPEEVRIIISWSMGLLKL